MMKLILVCIFLATLFIVLPHQIFAVSFTDHTGYIPSWASSLDNMQILSKCTSIQYGTQDFNWCSEFSGYVLDQDAGKASVSFTDHTGYEPSWALTMGPSQALSVCNMLQYGTQDSNWCYEFSSFVLNQSYSSNNSTGTSPQQPPSQPSTPQQNQEQSISILDFFPPSDANIFNNNLWDVSIPDGRDPFYDMGATQAQTRFYKSDYLDTEPTTEIQIGLFPDDESANSAMNNIMTFRAHQGFQTSSYNSNNSANCYEAKAPSDIAYIDDIVCKDGNLVVHVSASGVQWLTPHMARAFMDAVLNNISSQKTSTPQQPTSTNEYPVYAPCPTVQVTVPSDCLGRYLPTPNEIGSQWTSNGPYIPSSTNPNPMLTQYVIQDFENANFNPQESVEVIIEEWSSASSGYLAFKSEESSASSSKFFSGNPQSNDTSFAYIIDEGNNQYSYHEEFIIGTVIVMIDGTGGNGQTTFNDMGTIAKTILTKMQSPLQNNPPIQSQSTASSTTSMGEVNSQAQIPSWIKNNAKWWSEGTLSDTEFVSGIQYLIQHGLLKVPQTAQSPFQQSQQIPSWVKNTAGWWASGQVSDDEFEKGIQFLIQNGIITVSNTQVQSSNSQTQSPAQGQTYGTETNNSDGSLITVDSIIRTSDAVTTVKISGKLETFVSPAMVTLVITYPNGSTQDQAQINVNDDGTFTYNYLLGPTSPTGSYVIQVHYNNSETSQTSFNFN